VARSYVKINDRGWAAVLQRVQTAALQSDLRATVGIQGAQAAVDRGQHGEHINQATIATIHEYGSDDGHIPERSFIRSTLNQHQVKYFDLTGKLLANVILGRLDLRTALGRLGAKFASDIRATMRAGLKPALAPFTIEKRIAKIGAGATTASGRSKARSRQAKKRAEIAAGTATFKPLIDTGQLIGAIDWLVRVPPKSGNVRQS
jgi:hypothetical protein